MEQQNCLLFFFPPNVLVLFQLGPVFIPHLHKPFNTPHLWEVFGKRKIVTYYFISFSNFLLLCLLLIRESPLTHTSQEAEVEFCIGFLTKLTSHKCFLAGFQMLFLFFLFFKCRPIAFHNFHSIPLDGSSQKLFKPCGRKTNSNGCINSTRGENKMLH